MRNGERLVSSRRFDVATSVKWENAGQGAALRIDWSDLGAGACVDPYVAWFDLRNTRGAAEFTGLQVILELRREHARDADAHLASLGLSITAHYRHQPLPQSRRPRFVTALCATPDALRRLHQAVLPGDDPWVARFEISAGFANPDAVVLESGSRPAAVRKVAGPLVGFIDYGCAFLNRQFRDSEGNSRIHALWDPLWSPDTPVATPSLRWQPEQWFGRGGVTDATALRDHERAFTSAAFGLNELDAYRAAAYPSVERFATHGAHMMDIATGHPDPTRHMGQQRMCHAAKIVFAQLPRFERGAQVSGLLRAQVLDAAHFVASHLDATERGVINLSYGSNCGPHDGSSILERALDELLDAHRDEQGRQRLHIVLPSGNAADRQGHAQIDLAPGERQSLDWVNVPGDPSDSFVEVWAPAGARLSVRVVAPNGMKSAPVPPGQAQRLATRGATTALLIASAAPCQAESGVLWLLAVAPTAEQSGGPTASHGTWRIEVENLSEETHRVDAWCERDDPVFGQEAGPRQAFFANHVTPTGTLNSIAHGRLTTVVGGYRVHDAAGSINEGPVAAMSGTGPGRGLTGRDRHAARTGHVALEGPQVMAPCSLSIGDDGLRGTGVLSGDSLRLPGTSVSAAYWTRLFIENQFAPPPDRPPPVRFGVVPGRDDHPDDAWTIPRVP